MSSYMGYDNEYLAEDYERLIWTYFTYIGKLYIINSYFAAESS